MMEMENSMVMHLMNTQTQMLQELKDMRQKDSGVQMVTPPSVQMAPANNPSQQTMVSDIPMFRGENYYPMTTPTQTSSIPQGPVDPTQYKNNQHQLIGSVGSGDGLIGGTISDMTNFSPSRHSKESAGEHMAQRTRNLQEGAVGAVSSIGQGAAAVGSFLIPGGLVASLAVGGAVTAGVGMVGDQMVSGAKDSLRYQDILRRDGYKAFNAFESTTELGGVGMNLEDRQELSSFMRDLAPENFLKDEELSKVLQGSLDNKLLKSVSDVKGFKDKFSEIVKAVKEITITMDQSLEEAVAFMGEMERRGVSQKDMTFIAGQSKVTSSLLGVDANQYTQQMLQTTDSIVQGTSINASNVMESINTSAYIGGLVESESKNSEDQRLYNLIKNSGGGGAVAGQIEQNIRGYLSQGQGKDFLTSMFGSAFELNEETGAFEVDEAKMKELLNSGKSFRQLEDETFAKMGNMDETDKAKLAGSVGSTWNSFASVGDNYKLLGKFQETMQNEAGQPMDSQTALVTMGIAGNYDEARLMDEYMKKASDPNVLNRMDARALKEEMDSAAIANSPSFGERTKYWFKKNIGNTFGDAGQGISDWIGDKSLELQMWSSGIDDRSIVGGDLLEAYTAESIDKMYREKGGLVSDINSHLQESSGRAREEFKKGEEAPIGYGRDENGNISFGETAKSLKSFENIKIETVKNGERGERFTEDSFDKFISEMDEGTLSGSKIRQVKDNLKDGAYKSKDDIERAQYVVDKFDGEYDGFFGTLEQGWDRGSLAVKGAYDTYGDKMIDWKLYNLAPIDKLMEDGKKKANKTIDAREALLQEEKGLAGDYQKNKKSLEKIMSTSKDLGVSEEQYNTLEKLVAAGQVDKVKEMTSNSELIDLSEEFQTLTKQRAKHEIAMGQYTDLNREAEGLARMGDGLYDLVAASGVYDKMQLDDYLGGYKEEGKKFKKALGKKGGMGVQDMYDSSMKMVEEGEAVFEAMSPEQMQKMAEYMLKKTPNSGYTVEDLYIDGTQIMDSEKLYNFSEQILRQQQASDKKSKENAETDGDLSETAKTHKNAVTEMIETFKEEAKALQKANKDFKNGNYGNRYSSIGT